MSDSNDILVAGHKSFENEIRMLTEVKHRNIIKLYGFRATRWCMYLVYEYVEKGSLGNVLYGVGGKAELDWGRRLKIVQGVAHAIAYLHHDCTPPIVHRDITVNNILLDLEFEPRLSDFGIARLLSSETTTVAGSYGYMAPGKLTNLVFACLYCMFKVLVLGWTACFPILIIKIEKILFCCCCCCKY
jgi:serine/threonine protein kinase